MEKQQVDLIDEDEGLLSGLPVSGHPVQNAVQDHQHTDGHQLLAQFQDVIADQAVCGVHIGLPGGQCSARPAAGSAGSPSGSGGSG